MGVAVKSKRIENSATGIVIHGIGWNSYEKILSAFEDSHAAHFYYNQGSLEIMTLSFEHETVKRLINEIVGKICEETETDMVAGGSTTFKRKKKERGFEPDECYFFGEKIVKVRGKNKLDLAKDPPPDLIIEIDIYHSSLDRHTIFAGLGVNEVWRYKSKKVEIHRLHGDTYRQLEKSVIFPNVSASDLTDIIKQGQKIERPQWLKNLREYAKDLREKE